MFEQAHSLVGPPAQLLGRGGQRRGTVTAQRALQAALPSPLRDAALATPIMLHYHRCMACPQA
jgi:hypothetical protein